MSSVPTPYAKDRWVGTAKKKKKKEKEKRRRVKYHFVSKVE
jgi:hypothetical protein